MTFKDIKQAMSLIGEFIHRPKPPPLPPPFFNPDERKQTVVGGRTVLEPINKQAAMIIRPAAWWAKLNPNYERPKYTEKAILGRADIPKRKKQVRKSQGAKHRPKRKQPKIRVPESCPTTKALEKMGNNREGEAPCQDAAKKEFIEKKELAWRLLGI